MQAQATSIHSEVEQEIFRLLARTAPELRQIDRKISKLSEKLGIQVYSEFLYLLCHLRFTPSAARAHWRAILEHREKLAGKLGAELDFRVALLDYFISVNQHFESPKIIEIKIFQKTRDSAIRDELTGLFNYRYFQSELEREIKRAARASTSLSMLLFDVDHFKCYNDRNGHLEGDRALAMVARIIQETVRGTDLVARYGGEEFAVLLPEACKPMAFEVADRVRRNIAAHRFRFGKHQPEGRLTVSGGVATFRADANGSAELIEAADQALYRAKAMGRNQVLKAGSENREYPRVQVSIPGKLQLLSSRPEPFVTEDLSEQGLQLRCAVPLRKGEFFRFTLALADAGGEIEAVARSIQARKNGASHVVGARIVEISFQHAERLREFLQERNA